MDPSQIECKTRVSVYLQNHILFAQNSNIFDFAIPKHNNIQSKWRREAILQLIAISGELLCTSSSFLSSFDGLQDSSMDEAGAPHDVVLVVVHLTIRTKVNLIFCTV